jgi:hypothetical protein
MRRRRNRGAGARCSNPDVSSSESTQRTAGQREACGSCAHFRNDPRYLESAFPGWNVLGSAYGSTRAEDGICALRGIFLSASQWCASFKDRQS